MYSFRVDETTEILKMSVIVYDPDRNDVHRRVYDRYKLTSLNDSILLHLWRVNKNHYHTRYIFVGSGELPIVDNKYYASEAGTLVKHDLTHFTHFVREYMPEFLERYRVFL